jgi:ElaA protein
MIQFQTKTFQELTIHELYALLKLRAEVFVVEQNSVYLDVDDKDQKALHILGYINNKLVAYSRVFPNDTYFKEASIGRVVVAASERKHKYGHDLMRFAIDVLEQNFGKQTIKISAQSYLISFYQSHGFVTFGEEYLEDGIPHTAMFRN